MGRDPDPGARSDRPSVDRVDGPAGPDGAPGILFDVDGTLVDTNYLHTLAWSRALRSVGEWAPMNAIHRLTGMGGDQLVPELLGHDSPGASEARERAFADLIDDTEAFPGAADLVRACHDGGLRTVLATSSPAAELAHHRKVLDVDDALDAATGSDDVEASKPSPDVFVAAMEAAGLDPARALVVGDSVWDIRAADAAGIGCIALESGGFSRHELAEAGAADVYRDAGHLLARLHTSPIGWLLP